MPKLWVGTGHVYACAALWPCLTSQNPPTQYRPAGAIEAEWSGYPPRLGRLHCWICIWMGWTHYGWDLLWPGDNFQMMAHTRAWEHDAIGWQRFMESMICKSMQKIQRLYHFSQGIRLSPERWAQGLILKLLEGNRSIGTYRFMTWWRECRPFFGKKKFSRRYNTKWNSRKQGSWRRIIGWWRLTWRTWITSMTGEQEEYWLAAIKVAWLASKLTRQWADWAQWGLLQMGINFTRSTNPCEHRVGWLSVTHLTKEIVLEG